MGVRDADHLTLVLEHQHVGDLRPVAQIHVLLLPHTKEAVDVGAVHLRQSQVVPGAVTNHPRDALRGSVPVDPPGVLELGSRIGPHTGMIVVEHVGVRVCRVADTAHPDIAGTQVAARYVLRQCLLPWPSRLSNPWPALAVRGHDYPLLSERVPAFLPHRRHAYRSLK